MIGRQAETLKGGSSDCILSVVTEKRLRIRNITSSFSSSAFMLLPVQAVYSKPRRLRWSLRCKQKSSMFARGSFLRKPSHMKMCSGQTELCSELHLTATYSADITQGCLV